MSIIKITNRAASYSDEPEPTPAVNNPPPPDTYQAALLELGNILLNNQDEDDTPWLSIRKISAQCYKHWTKLPSLDYSMEALKDWANDYFRRSGEIRGDKAKVTYKTEPSESQRPPDLYIQFSRVFPDGHCH